MIDARTRSLLRIWAIVTLVATIDSGIFGVIYHDWTIGHFVTGALFGLAIAGPMTLFETIGMAGPIGAALRRCPFGVAFAIRSAVYVVWIVLVITLGGFLRQEPGEPPPYALPSYPVYLAFSVVVSVSCNFLMMVNRLLGPRVLVNFLLGRYHRPRTESRVLLFIDLAGSTAAAERLGNLGFHQYLRQFVEDVSMVVMENGGEIHRYIGDEVIITWEMHRRAGQTTRAVDCVFAVRDRIAANGDLYHAQFGEVPSFRAALHLDTVVAGEMGAFKQEIVFLGDGMNTASRIEQACRATGHPVLASRSLIDASKLPPDVSAISLGPVVLRGKQMPLELFALDRHPERSADTGADEGEESGAAAQFSAACTLP